MPDWVVQMGYVLLGALGAAIILPLGIFSGMLVWVVIRAWTDARRKLKEEDHDDG